MLTYYQPFLYPFIRRARYVIPCGVRQTHFLSFEDALWVILLSKNIPKQSVVLVPDFYCLDVVNNIAGHGYIPVFYPLDDHFQVDQTAFARILKKYNPQVVILFHACGITNVLLEDTAYIRKLCASMLIIEDCVHRLVNPQQVSIVSDNHFIIDSVRKVSPLSGSFVYSKEEIKVGVVANKYHEHAYIMASQILYFLFRIVFLFGVLVRSYNIISYAHLQVLKQHDDLIGDSTFGYGGRMLSRAFHRHLNFAQVEYVKEKQVAMYEAFLEPLYRKRSSYWYRVHFPQEDRKYLHVYPLAVRLQNARIKIEELLQQNKIPVWFKFSDSPWAKERAVLFLPLGFHVTNADIPRVCNVLLAMGETA